MNINDKPISWEMTFSADQGVDLLLTILSDISKLTEILHNIVSIKYKAQMIGLYLV